MKASERETFPAAAVLAAASSVDALRQNLLFGTQGLTRELDKIAILGAGGEGVRLAEICHKQGIDVVGFYDANARKRGMKANGKVICPAEALSELPKEVPIIVASHRTLGACETMRALGHVIFPLALLQVGMPEKFSPHSFYENLLEDMFENRDEYMSLYEIFTDDRSRQVLDAVLAYRLTLDPLRLRGVIDWDLYGSIQLGPEEVYVDGGTYNGDSIQMFIDHVGGRYLKVHGFEPDPKTFETLKARLGKTPRVDLHNSGLFSRTGKLGFSADSSRAAKFDDRVENKIAIVSIDDAVKDRVTFIKMNIEGAEIEALKGARTTIVSSRPKLAISAYHRASDLRVLVRLIRELNSQYRLRLRQHDGGIIETVIYATD